MSTRSPRGTYGAGTPRLANQAPGPPVRAIIDRQSEGDAADDGQCESHRPGPGRAPLAVSAHPPYRSGMCRSIKTLRRPGETATTGELEAAARQYVRKLSGFREPSARNRDAFDAAIAEIADASRRLVESVGVAVEEGPDRWTPRSGEARSRPRVLA
jgi:hypothetical protein